MLPQTGTEIASVAQKAMHDPNFAHVAGECQMFARQVAEAVGGQIGAAMDKYRTGTATGTLENFAGTPYLIWRHGDGEMPVIQKGDFLYKSPRTSGAAGHVGVAGNGEQVGLSAGTLIVWENSSFHTLHSNLPGRSGNGDGAKGWRAFPAFQGGNNQSGIDGIVRLTP